MIIGTNEVYLPQSEASRVPKRGKLSKVLKNGSDTGSREPLVVTISYIVIIVVHIHIYKQFISR